MAVKDIINRFSRQFQLPRLVLRDFNKRRTTKTLWVFLVLLLIPLVIGLCNHCGYRPGLMLSCEDEMCVIIHNSWYQFVLLTVLNLMAITLCNSLTNIFSLKRKESAITLCQISILFFLGIWIVGILIIFDILRETSDRVYIGGASALLTWIFQDTIKGVVAFIHLRLNNSLHIDDWIQVPKYGVDGEIKRVSLTTVTVYNVDTTTSSIPTSLLHSEHFINIKNMMDGKTYGRRMYKTFILDTDRFHTITKEEAEHLRGQKSITQYLSKDEIVEGCINAHLFRLYLFHWLMNHPKVSQQPRLIVCWSEQVESGMPLLVYAFITDCSLAAFEWQQSQIIEHIIESLNWFGLCLFQSPSSHDVNNNHRVLLEKLERRMSNE